MENKHIQNNPMPCQEGSQIYAVQSQEGGHQRTLLLVRVMVLLPFTLHCCTFFYYSSCKVVMTFLSLFFCVWQTQSGEKRNIDTNIT